MKLRKILGIIVVIAMISTLALSASAAETVKLTVKDDKDWNYISVSGDETDNPIHNTLIRTVKITLDFPDHKCGPSDEDPTAECDKKCMSVVAFGGPIKFADTETKFCYKEKKSFEFKLNDLKWADGVGDDYYLKIGAANWNGAAGTASIEVLDADGKLLAAGQQPEAPSSSSAPTSSNAPSSVAPTGNSKALNTGVGGVLALGGMAILAAGAVVISRKRK